MESTENELEELCSTNKEQEYYVYEEEKRNNENGEEGDDESEYEEVKEVTDCHDEEIQNTNLMANVFIKALQLVRNAEDKYEIYKMYIFYLVNLHGNCSLDVRTVYEDAIKDFKAKNEFLSAQKLCEEYASMESQNSTSLKAQKIYKYCEHHFDYRENSEMWMNRKNLQLTTETDQSGNRKDDILAKKSNRSYKEEAEELTESVLLPLEEEYAKKEENVNVECLQKLQKKKTLQDALIQVAVEDSVICNNPNPNNSSTKEETTQNELLTEALNVDTTTTESLTEKPSLDATKTESLMTEKPRVDTGPNRVLNEAPNLDYYIDCSDHSITVSHNNQSNEKNETYSNMELNYVLDQTEKETNALFGDESSKKYKQQISCTGAMESGTFCRADRIAAFKLHRAISR